MTRRPIDHRKLVPTQQTDVDVVEGQDQVLEAVNVIAAATPLKTLAEASVELNDAFIP